MFCAMLRKLAKYTTLLNLYNAKICWAGFPETKRKEITKRFLQVTPPSSNPANSSKGLKQTLQVMSILGKKNFRNTNPTLQSLVVWH